MRSGHDMVYLLTAPLIEDFVFCLTCDTDGVVQDIIYERGPCGNAYRFILKKGGGFEFKYAKHVSRGIITPIFITSEGGKEVGPRLIYLCSSFFWEDAFQHVINYFIFHSEWTVTV